jgi:N4-gp56 family major capsid protein
MADILTTTTQLTVGVQDYYNRTLLGRLQPLLTFVGYGMEKPVPKKSGVKITWRRYANLSAATTALTEGVTPQGSQMSKTDYAATVLQYGDYVMVSDWVRMVGYDAELTEAAGILGDQAGNTLDQLCRDVLVAGTSVEYASAVTSRATVDAVIVAADVEKAENFLSRNNVMPINERIVASTKVSTYGIDPAYIAIGHIDLLKDLRAITGFIEVKEYASQRGILPGEVGSYGRIRFVLTSNGKIWSGGGATGTTFRNDGANNDVYGVIVFGKGAYGNSSIGPRSVQNIVHKEGGTHDPLNQRATSGWKASFITKILSDLRLCRIEVACTDLSMDAAATSE